MLLFFACAKKQTATDWPDDLAADLMENPSLKLCQWAEQMGLAPWTVSRNFRKVFGVSPEAFRARARTRQAWKRIQNTQEPLAKIAVHLGFADQPHMTRSVRQLTGSSPQMWRVAANGFNTR
jgi:AraC-like DNA-binding protein